MLLICCVISGGTVWIVVAFAKWIHDGDYCKSQVCFNVSPWTVTIQEQFLGSHLTACRWKGCYPVLFLGLHCCSGDANLPIGQVFIWRCSHLKCCQSESDSTVCITAIELWGLCWCVMFLNCTSFFVDVPSSFSPFVEFKEKTQQWKLLGNLHFSMIFTVVKLFYSPCCSPEMKFSRSIISVVRPFVFF